MADPWGCPESVNGSHSPPDHAGRCSWCGQRFTYPAPYPGGPYPDTALEEAYGLYWDPDYDPDD